MIFKPSSDDIRLASIVRSVLKKAVCPVTNTTTHTPVQNANSPYRPSSPGGIRNGTAGRQNAPITSCEKITSRREERYFRMNPALHT